jgi:hypothetical protein
MKLAQIVVVDTRAPSAATFLIDSVPSLCTTEPPDSTNPAIPKASPTGADTKTIDSEHRRPRGPTGSLSPT